jgi:hypothetical protein
MTRVSTFGFPRTAATGALVAVGTGASVAVGRGAATAAGAAGAAVGAGARVAVGGTGVAVASLPQATATIASNMINEETRTFDLNSQACLIVYSSPSYDEYQRAQSIA